MRIVYAYSLGCLTYARSIMQRFDYAKHIAPTSKLIVPDFSPDNLVYIGLYYS